MRIRENRHLQVIKNIDILLILTTLSLSIYGIIVVSTASNHLGAESFVKTQLFASILGIVAMCAIAFADYEAIFKKYWYFLTPISLFLLFLPLVFGEGGNNSNWITIPIINFNFQPSEFVKIIFIIAFAFHLSAIKDDINTLKNVILLLLHGGVVVLFLMLEGDLGATVMYVCIMIVMCFMAGLSLWYYLGGLAALLAVLPILWGRLADYQKMRILVGFDPTQDPDEYGYQVLQTMKAISNGGLKGMGYRQGTITQNPSESALPARQTDMILSAIGEEFGFIGILLFFALMILLVVRIIMIARSCTSRCGSYICMGVAAVFVAQTLENVGMCLGMLPVIGITLPFISYGGSSVMALYMCIGAVLSVGAHKSDTKLKFE